MANILNENFDSLKQLFTDCLNAKNDTKGTVSNEIISKNLRF